MLRWTIFHFEAIPTTTWGGPAEDKPNGTGLSICPVHPIPSSINVLVV
jgi:hypothetical protein